MHEEPVSPASLKSPLSVISGQRETGNLSGGKLAESLASQQIAGPVFTAVNGARVPSI